MKKASCFFLLFWLLMVLNACNKTDNNNFPPAQVVANAGESGSFKILFTPGNCNPENNAVQLDGSKSTSETGIVNSYKWTYLQNAPQNTGGLVQIVNPNKAKTAVIVTSPGDYWFSLRVFDAHGGSSSDSVKMVVTTDNSNLQNIVLQPQYAGILNKAVLVAMTTANRKIFLQYFNNSSVSGGFLQTTDKFKVFDLDSKSWSDLAVATGRTDINMLSAGNKLVLGGGLIQGVPYHKVDIMDNTTGNWTYVALPDNFIITNSAVEGNKIFFTGYYASNPNTVSSDNVEILDLTTNSWTSTKTSQKRSATTIIPAGDLVYFTNNYLTTPSTKVVDVYQISTNSWTSITTNAEYTAMKGVAFNGKIYFYGNTDSDGLYSYVVAWDPKTGGFEQICMGGDYVTIYPYGSQLLIYSRQSSYYEDTKVSLYKYDPATSKWTVGYFTNPDLVIGGVGAVIEQSGPYSIFTVGPTSYPDSFIDFHSGETLADYSFWEMEF